MVGAYLDEAAQRELLDQLILESGVSPLLMTPPGVEARLRLTPNGDEIMILINHTRQKVEVPLPWPALDLLLSQPITSTLILPPYEVVLFKQEV